MARSRNIGNVYAELSVKDKMTAGMKRAEKSLASLGGKLASFGKGVALAAPVAAFAGLAASMKSAIDAGGQLSDMMARTGADGEGLFVMQRAFENAGIAASQVPSALNRMQKALATANPGFEKLGLSVRELSKMDATDAFRATSEAIAALPDPAQRAAAAMEIFGKAGGQLLVVMNDGKAFQNAATQVGGLGKTLSDNAARLDNVSDSMQLLGVKAQQIGAEVAVELLPALESMADAMNELNLSEHTKDAIGFAKAIGDAASGVMKYIKNSAAGQRAGLFMSAAGAGISALASLNPEEGTAMPTPDAWVGGNPLANYVENIMLEGVKGYTEAIPALLKRRPELWTAPGMSETGIPIISDLLATLKQEIPAMGGDSEPGPQLRDWQATSYDVNEMQRRGLGFGGENIAKEQNKQVDLLTQIRDLIKSAPDKDLVWN